MRNGIRRHGHAGADGVLRVVARRQRTGQAGDRHRRSGRQPHPVAPSRPQLRRPLSLARRLSPQPPGQSRAAVVQVLGLRHRRRRLQLRDEDRRRRVPRSPADAGRSGRHRARDAAPPAGSPRPGSRSTPSRAAKTPRRPHPAKGNARCYKAMAWAESQYHQCLLNVARGRAGPAVSRTSGASRPRASSSSTSVSRRCERDWILPGPAKAARPAGRRFSRRSASWPAGRKAADTTTASAAGVLFSIRDAQGRPVGIGGRVLPELGITSPAKYVNSPETPLFTKSKLLYGLDLAREAIAQEPHGAGDGRLHRRDRGPSVWLHRRGGRAGHRLGRAPHPDPQALRRSDRAGARRRRGRHSGGPTRCSSCSSPSRSICGSSRCPTRLDPCDFLHKRRGRGVCRIAGRRAGRCAGARLSTSITRGRRRGARRPRREPGARAAGVDRGQGPAAAATTRRAKTASAKRRSCSGWRPSSASTSGRCGGG